MKRLLIALGLAGVVGAGVFGLAASLNTSSDTLGAGSAVVAACQSGTVNVSYTPTYSSTATAGYRATSVTLNGLEAGCLDKSFKVTLTGAGDVSLGEQTGSTPASGTTQSMTFTNVAAASITGVHVTIYG